MRSVAKRQQGVALLVALLVVALAVILVAALLDRGELTLARTRNALRSEQAEAYAQGLEIYAAQILLDTQNQGDPDSNASPWAVPLPPQAVPGGVISASMQDMNGCFNLNNLAPGSGSADGWLRAFQRLLEARGVVDPSLAEAVQNWLTEGAGSADDNFYLAQPVPYRSSRRNFAQASELRLVRGFDGDTYAKLAPYVCALPTDTTINLNTASVPVLQSLGFTEPVAEKIWNNGHANYHQTQSGLEADEYAVLTSSGLAGRVVVSSSYFLARGEILLDEVPFTFYSLIERANGQLRVIARSRGSDDALVVAAPIDAGKAHEDTLH
jgi:general secretion pathway protein K